MLNFNDPAVAASTQDEWVQVKFWHTLSGIYLWEFFTTLDYEWRVIRGHSPYRWTIWIYALTRLACLAGVVLAIISMDVKNPINCQLWIFFELFFSYFSVAPASLLIVLRVIAIWNRNKVVVAIAIGTWGINVAFLVLGTARLRSTWAPTQLTCLVVNSEDTALTLISMAATDIVLLLVMLVGLLRIRYDGGATFGVSHLLWKQGVIWALLSAIAEVPPAVLIILNLNYRLSVMFQFSSMVIMAIAATRMHRSLVEFSSRPSDQCAILYTKTKRTYAPPTSFNPMDISVRAVIEQHLTLQINCDDSSINTDEQTHKDSEQNGSRLDEDIERR